MEAVCIKVSGLKFRVRVYAWWESGPEFMVKLMGEWKFSPEMQAGIGNLNLGKPETMRGRPFQQYDRAEIGHPSAFFRWHLA
jgi:hypothetical protein